MNDLEISYECLNAIGNTFDLYSMISEVLITFAKSTEALGAGYHSDEQETALIKIGIPINLQDYQEIEQNEIYSIYHSQDRYIIQLHLHQGYLLFSYNKTLDTVQHTAALLSQFNQKITLAINACNGISQLVSLNESLEETVQRKVKKLREQEHMLLLKSKQAIMGELIEMIAHQWRQPLTAAGMAVNNLLFDITLDELSPESLSNGLTMINQQIDYLSHTIDDFRNFFHPDSEKVQTSIGELVRDTVTLIDKQFEKHSIKVRFNTNDDIEIFTYKHELMQVLLNLLTNAKDALIEHDSNNKIIQIEYSDKNDTINITVSDNGDGIPEKILTKIFEPYFSTKKEKNGTGLGLYMSHSIVHEHLNGTLTATNNADGGASFTISLPKEEKA